MSHYFIPDESLSAETKVIRFSFRGHALSFETHAGVFSKDHVDEATQLLLEQLPPLHGSLLDLGCGYGCIGIALAKAYGLTLTQCDVNPQAVKLAEQNTRRNGVTSTAVVSDCFENVPGTFDTITLNPPIHAGKAVTYRMYEEAAAHLNPDGRLYVVTLKKHGAESTRAKLCEVFAHCETVYQKKGYYVFAAGC